MQLILVVDDDDRNRKLVRDVLQAAGLADARGARRRGGARPRAGAPSGRRPARRPPPRPGRHRGRAPPQGRPGDRGHSRGGPHRASRSSRGDSSPRVSTRAWRSRSTPSPCPARCADSRGRRGMLASRPIEREAPWTDFVAGDTITRSGRVEEESTCGSWCTWRVRRPLVALQIGGGAATASSNDATIQREADLYQIDQIEVKFHRATSHHDINLMMSLWAPGAVFNIDQADAHGEGTDPALVPDQERRLHAEPSLGVGHAVLQDQGRPERRQGDDVLRVPLHRSGDVEVVALAGVTHTLQKVNGQWLITNSAGSTAVLQPVGSYGPS